MVSLGSTMYRRHRQAESVISVELIQLVSELRISRFGVMGKYEYEAKVGCYLQPAVRQTIETQIETTMDRASVSLKYGKIAIRLAPSSFTA